MELKALTHNGWPGVDEPRVRPNNDRENNQVLYVNQDLRDAVTDAVNIGSRSCKIATNNLKSTRNIRKIGVVIAYISAGIVGLCTVFLVLGMVPLSGFVSPSLLGIIVLVAVISLLGFSGVTRILFDCIMNSRSNDKYKQDCITSNMVTINSLSNMMHIMFPEPDASTVLSGEQNKVLASNIKELLDPQNNKNKVFTNFTELADCYNALLTKPTTQTLDGEDLEKLKQKK